MNFEDNPITLRIAFVAPITNDAITGPRNSVTKLATALNQRADCSAQVFSTRSDMAFTFNDSHVLPVAKARWHEFDCVVFSGVWLPEYIALAKRLKQAQIPYIISPRSSLMRSQFKQSLHKKLPFLCLGGWRLLTSAAAIHFLTADEKRQSAFARKGFVSSNMLDPTSLQKAGRVVATKAQMIQNKTFGFLGRYTIAHKGLDRLLDAVAMVAEEMRAQGWTLRMRGSDNRGEKHQLAKRIATQQLNDVVELGEAVSGDEKSDFLQAVDVFVHTSRYEGQPQAVMEAMAYGCAVLVTPGANMTTAVQQGSFGYLAELNAASIAEQMRACMAGSEQVARYQRNAAVYALAHYDDRSAASAFNTALRKIFSDINN